MAVKRFVHEPLTLVHAACKGQLALHPGLLYDEENKIIYRIPQAGKVTILSGGGSGHEPAHAGYVGEGMLDAAVCGAIFSSPNVIQIEKGLQLVQVSEGTLVIVKNYTGDMLNFGLSVEKSRSRGNNVRMVVVGDDVSIGRSNNKMVGRRGLAGTVLVHKIAGAAAAKSLSLDEVADISQFAAENLATIGVGLNRCDVPGQQRHMDLALDEIELGLGIHNEPGSRRLNPQPATADLISDMLSALLDTTDADRSYLATSPAVDKNAVVVLLINNLGGLYEVKPHRVYCGTFLSALNGSGFSVTVLSLPAGEKSDQILSFLDAPTAAIGWTSSIPSSIWSSGAAAVEAPSKTLLVRQDEPSVVDCDNILFSNILKSVHKSLSNAEPEITHFDTLIGDGDCGTTLCAGASALTSGLTSGVINVNNLAAASLTISELLSRRMGGTSGALYAIFFTSLASTIRCSSRKMERAWSIQELSISTSAALDTLMKYTRARTGDRTMMDALIPFVHQLRSSSEAGFPALVVLERAVKSAQMGCDKTCSMKSRFGRSTYVGANGTMSDIRLVPDPGACGVVAIVRGILDALKGKST